MNPIIAINQIQIRQTHNGLYCLNDPSERNGVDYTQALITSKGQAKLAQHFAGERQA